MTTSPRPASSPVVVGVDGSAPSRLAVAWAVREAARWRRPVHLVHAYAAAADAAAAARLLEDALEEARALANDVDLTGELRGGSPAAALIHLSHRAHQMVLGGRGRGGLGSALLGSVSEQVASHSDASVVVLKDVEDPQRPRDGVTVGVDGSVQSQACLAYAFEQAAARGTSLDVVHAFSADRSMGTAVLADVASAAYQVEPRHQLLLSEALAGWSQKYPDVDVVRSVVHAHAVPALLSHADGAELLVVGSRGREGLSRLLLGSVSRGVLQRAGCPVAVVRDRPHH